MNTDVNLPGTPFALRQAVGVSHAETDDGIFLHSKSRILLFVVESNLSNKKTTPFKVVSACNNVVYKSHYVFKPLKTSTTTDTPKMVGVTGFEPAASSSPTKRSYQTELHPDARIIV